MKINVLASEGLNETGIKNIFLIINHVFTYFSKVITLRKLKGNQNTVYKQTKYDESF